MTKKKNTKVEKEAIEVEATETTKEVKEVKTKKASQSTDKVSFKCSKDSEGLKKDKVYIISENVADVLESKGLGKRV